jgi:cytochrome P450
MNDHAPTGWPRGAKLTARHGPFREAPETFYERLRRFAPHFHDTDYGRILLTRYDDVRAALRDRSLSVDATLSRADSYTRRIAGTGVTERIGDTAYTPPLVLLDDPAHRRIRSLVSKAFTPTAIQAMAPRIEWIADELIRRLRGCDTADFIEAFAAPLPTWVITDMMGLPQERIDDFNRWSVDILMGYDPDRDATVQRALRDAYVGMTRVIREIVTVRRSLPQSDLISRLVQAQEADDRLGDLEIVSLCVQLMVAGNATTSDLMGNGLSALLDRPEQLSLLQANPGLMAQAVEEMLRFDCPLTETARIATTSIQLGGCAISGGDTLTLSLAAANRDPARFDRPDQFDILRTESAHLAFGGGIHACLGAPLARLEAQIGLSRFIAAFPGLHRATAAPERRRLPFFRGFSRLPLQLQ